jgi:hypothetical protein
MGHLRGGRAVQSLTDLLHDEACLQARLCVSGAPIASLDRLQQRRCAFLLHRARDAMSLE